MASLTPRTGVLGKRLAAHLLRRTSFNYTRQRVDDFATKTVAQAVNELLAPAPALQLSEPIDPETNQTWISTNDTTGSTNSLKRIYLMGYWFNELINDSTINMKMAFFLHTNFATSWEVAGSTSMHAYDHHLLLRQYAQGNFKDLTKKITLDNLMLIYLNNRQNRESAPNENYARELLELFTLGKDPQIYTEDDVKAAAKVLTGFTIAARDPEFIDPDTGLFAGRAVYGAHDNNDKEFSGAFDPTGSNNPTVITGAVNREDMFRELDDFLDMIFGVEAASKHICRKLYRYFVHTNVNAEIESDIIDELASTFRSSNYELKPVLEQLLKSQHFYGEDDYGINKIIGGIIKSPLELLSHTITFFDVNLPDQLTDTQTFYITFTRGFLNGTYFELTGFLLNAPDTVASYPAYHQAPQWDNAWFISSTIIPRYKIGQMFTTNRRILSTAQVGAEIDSVNYIENPLNITDPGEASKVVSELLEYLFPESPNQERLDYFLDDIFLEGLDELNWFFEWQHYQENNDDSDVRIPLNALIVSLTGTPEFQLM